MEFVRVCDGEKGEEREEEEEVHVWPESGGCRHIRAVDSGENFVRLVYTTCMKRRLMGAPFYLILGIHTDFLVRNCLFVSGTELSLCCGITIKY